MDFIYFHVISTKHGGLENVFRTPVLNFVLVDNKKLFINIYACKSEANITLTTRDTSRALRSHDCFQRDTTS